MPPGPGAKPCVLRVLSASVEEISYEKRFRVAKLKTTECGWGMGLEIRCDIRM